MTTNLLLPNFYVLPALSSQLSVISKLCIMNTVLNFLLLLCQSCRSLRKISLGGRILGLIKSNYHGCLSMMTSSEVPFLVLPRALPTLNLPLDIHFGLDCFVSKIAMLYLDLMFCIKY